MNNIKRFIKLYIYMPIILLLDSVFLFLFYWRRSSNKDGAIFFLHGLGDLVIAANALNVLSEYIKAKGLRSILFVEPNLVNFCKTIVCVDEVMAISRRDFVRNIPYRLKVISSIAHQFSIAIQPHYNRQIFVEDSLIRIASHTERLGNNAAGLYISKLERLIGDSFYTKLIDLSPNPVHDLIRNREFVGKFGLDIHPEPFFFKEDHIKWLDLSFLEEPYMVVAPYSSHPMKTWPLQRFIYVASEIATKFNLLVVFIDSKHRCQIIWPESVTHKAPIINFCGETSINDLVFLIKGAHLVLGNDSAVFHLSVALRTPVVSIGGGGMPVRFFPYPSNCVSSCVSIDYSMDCFGCGWNCIYSISPSEAAPCILGVSIDEVISASEGILAKNTLFQAP